LDFGPHEDSTDDRRVKAHCCKSDASLQFGLWRNTVGDPGPDKFGKGTFIDDPLAAWLPVLRLGHAIVK